MSGASHTLDPVAAARDDIHRSKHLIASTLDDLQQHHRWLEDYHRAERRRMQRLHRREVLHQLELKRRRTVGTLRRVALISWFVARAIAAFVVECITAFLITTYLFLVAACRVTAHAARWTAPRMVALALFLEKQLTAGLAWSWATGRDLAREGARQSATVLSWMVRTSDTTGAAFRQRLGVWFAALSANAVSLARPIRAKASLAFAQARHWSDQRTAAMHARAAETWSWLALETRRTLINASRASARTRHWSKQRTAAMHARAAETWSWLALETRRTRINASRASRRTRHWSKRSVDRLRAQLSVRRSRIAEVAVAVPPMLQRQSAAAATWTRARSKHLALATQHLAFAASAAASAGWTFAGLTARRVLAKRDLPQTSAHRALIVRQCTALVIFEPRRARLPVVRAG